ncbi:MAG: hypothetical protein ACOX87_10080 [Chloroflexota bacterium]|jgi:hypothetical protein
MSALRRSEEDIIRLTTSDDLRTYLDTIAGHGPTQEAVIQVETDDDLTSIRSKLESVRVPRAVVVIPSNSKVLKDGVEYRVLRRLQRDLGLDFVIISNDLRRRALATENGFRNVYRSMKAYYRSKSSRPDTAETVPFSDPEEFAPALSISRWGLLIGVAFSLLLALLAYLLIPVATVEIYPETQALTRDVEVLVEIGGPRLDTTAQRLSGRLIEEQVVVQGTVNVKDVAPPPADGAQSSGFGAGTNVTLEVRDALRNLMLQQANAQAAEKLKAQLSSNDSMPEASIRTEISAERYDHNIGDVAETLSGTMEVKATGLAFNNNDFNKLIQALWSQDIPREHVVLGEINISPPEVISSEGRHMRLRVQASGAIQPVIDADVIVSAVRGKSLTEAKQLVATTGEYLQPPEITMWPDWASRAIRVQVVTVLKRATASP